MFVSETILRDVEDIPSSLAFDECLGMLLDQKEHENLVNFKTWKPLSVELEQVLDNPFV
jgi:hypothetical protein